MARQLCIEFKNAFYHICSRGLNKQTLFYDNDDFNIFINLLRKTVNKYNLRLFAFCLMTNHYHLYLSTPEANISKCIKFLNETYARYYLKKYLDKDGHVFRGRYLRKLVEDEKYSLSLIAYILNNPFKLVKNIDDWKYSSYPSYLNKTRRFDFIDYNWTLSRFANNTSSFLQFHNHMLSIKWNPEDYTIANNFIASQEYIQRISEQYIDSQLINEEDISGINYFKNKLDLTKILSLIKDLDLPYKTKIDLEIYFSKELANLSLKEIAEKYHKTTKAISKSNLRFKNDLKQNKKLKSLTDIILKKVSV